MKVCPCASSASYDTCCGPLHAGGEPRDAVTLMRSRYSAFVLSHYEHLVSTLHPDHDDRTRSRDELIASLRESGKRTRYRGLRILDHSPADAEGIHRVLFHVSLSFAGKDASFVELSSFVHDGTGLRYVGGVSYEPKRLGELGSLRIASLPRG